MRTFGQTEKLVIAELSNLGVVVTEDPDTSEYYALDCRKDSFTGTLYHNDIDWLYNSNAEEVKAYCARFENKMTSKKPVIKNTKRVFSTDIYDEF